MRTSRELVVAAGAALAALVPAAPAAAAPPACGDTVSGTVVLTADLVCSGTGLVLTDGTTLDLAGHRVVGDGDGAFTGLLVPPDGDVTVRGGVVTGWEEGVASAWENPTAEVGHLLLDGMTLRDNAYGVRVIGLVGSPPEVEVTSSRFTGNGTGVAAIQAQPVSVTSSRFVENATGAYVSSGRSVVTVLDSVFAHNGSALGCTDGGGCEVVDSTLRDNGTGVSVTDLAGATLRGTTLARNGRGVDCNRSGLHLEDDDLRDNDTGARLYNCGGAVVASTFLRNDVGLSAQNPDEPVELAVRGSTFRRNGDGLLVLSGPSALEGSTAIRNERWGIHAPGATDLGGNTARGNGNEPQCVGVACGDAGPAS